MSDAPSLVVFLGFFSICLIAMTMTILVTARELRQTLQHANRALTGMDRAVGEAHRCIEYLRHIFSRADQATRHVESIVHRSCDIVSDTVDQLATFNGRAKAFLMGRSTNGTRVDPRPNGRRGAGNRRRESG